MTASVRAAAAARAGSLRKSATRFNIAYCSALLVPARQRDKDGIKTAYEVRGWHAGAQALGKTARCGHFFRRTEALASAISPAMTELLVESADGTVISAESHGRGRALVVVSGALFAAERWLNVVKILSEKHCVYVVDRRGRGKSGDSAPYAPEREIEDLLAVLNAIPGPIALLGHSSGAILALEVAARAPSKLERLVVYEPPVFFAEADLIAQDLPERLQALLARGERELAVETFLREGPRNSEDSLRGLKQSTGWAPLVAALGHTVPYDSLVQREFRADPTELARIRIPTLMLVGSASPERMQSGAQTIAARLPNARLRELPDQQHMAMLQAPALFAHVVDDFLAGA